MLFLLIMLAILHVNADICGPEGYNAEDILSPNYWYFDVLNDTQCPPFKSSKSISNQTGCRIYFNLCNDMAYQCAGTVCARYLETQDTVIILGQYNGNPFNEDSNSFQASYQGEQLLCAKGMDDVITKIIFNCDEKSIWNTSVSKEHGGAKAPEPIASSFDRNLCQYSMVFNCSKACYVAPKHDTKSHTISNGSFMLILVIPGFALYMLLGILFNLARGKRGKEMIPHLTFWAQLPDLIMDGFAFTMATITCRHEDRFTQEYRDIE